MTNYCNIKCELEEKQTDQRVMTLFSALNLEAALRVAADTLVLRFIPAIPKIVTKLTSEVNNVSSNAELTQERRLFRVIIFEDHNRNSIIIPIFLHWSGAKWKCGYLIFMYICVKYSTLTMKQYSLLSTENHYCSYNMFKKTSKKFK
ncbi:Hypothetical_protein [Hexamita inflata]|uniref:Hypothetical_protein n=1 Tax=Hexamita inflata TaxID=28002 RepID=A0AA86UEH6_9EUKA|nr:Hypothetical protein HINF_LOCUS40184 [Hexamita inflata]